MKTERAKRIFAGGAFDLGEDLSHSMALYDEGDMEGGVALLGQIFGRIDKVKPVAAMVEDIMTEFNATVGRRGGYAVA